MPGPTGRPCPCSRRRSPSSRPPSSQSLRAAENNRSGSRRTAGTGEEGEPNAVREARGVGAVEAADEGGAGHVGPGEVEDGRRVDVVEAGVALHVEGLRHTRVVLLEEGPNVRLLGGLGKGAGLEKRRRGA